MSEIQDIAHIAKNAKVAAHMLASSSAGTRDDTLVRLAANLDRHKERVFGANAADLANAASLNDATKARLKFGEPKLASCVEGLKSLSKLPDPLNETTLSTRLMDGLTLYRVSCPIGVVGVIFEARPDALIQIASLCVKSGNASILKGGSETKETNKVLYEIIRDTLVESGLPEHSVSLVETREDVRGMLALDENIDLIIPRGSASFVRYIKENTRIPVLGHADGICHAYVDCSNGAVYENALRVVIDFKTQYPAVCNAIETLLIHKDCAATFLPKLKEAMPIVELRGDERTREIIECEAATDDDWRAEYLDYILSVKVVDSLEQAIDHINAYGSHHTDIILTSDTEHARTFTRNVDSADVFVNCSSRFADGFRFGFGAEVGISTGKIHARGPVGLPGLTTYKYVAIGSGQTVADIASGKTAFTHIPIKEDCPL